jgi:hypothetical protein
MFSATNRCLRKVNKKPISERATKIKQKYVDHREKHKYRSESKQIPKSSVRMENNQIKNVKLGSHIPKG